MRMKITAVLACIALCAAPALAEDLKAFKLTIDGVAVDIDPGESVDVTLPGGKTAKVALERNDFATFSGDVFSFVHPSGLSIGKSDLGDHITQYLMASAVGTIVVVQEYGTMNPVSLDQLMLQEMSKEAVQAGARLTQEPTTRRLADGREMTGIRATVKARADTDYYEIVGFGTADQGLLVITRIDADNVAAETVLLDKFWQSLDIKL